jgi:hypothetical protein
VLILALGAKIKVKRVKIKAASSPRVLYPAASVKTGCGTDLCFYHKTQ